MAWPSDKAAGDLITAAAANAIIAAIKTWEGDVAAGGYNLTGLATITLNSTGGQPAAGADYRGRLWYTQSAGGTADIVEICVKLASDSYAWIALF